MMQNNLLRIIIIYILFILNIVSVMCYIFRVKFRQFNMMKVQTEIRYKYEYVIRLNLAI